MDWFRMYGEFASDPKVQSMSEAMQRRLMMLFCLRCSNTLVTLQDDEISFALRISNEDLAETKALFIRKGFINDEWEIANWDKRQFVSDSSAARVARHRERKKQEANQACNVTVTPQIQSRTDTEQNREEKPGAPKTALDPYPTEFETVWAEYPKRPGASKKESFKAWKARIKSGVAADKILQGVRSYAAYVIAKGTEPDFIKQPETFFGPGEHYAADWTVHAARAPTDRRQPPPDNFRANNYGTPGKL